MPCEYAEWDGAYVLGALSPSDRVEFERHLATCERCARAVGELAGLPGLLSRVDAAVLEDRVTGDPPETLLPALVREVRGARRRRRVVTAAAAAAAVVAVTVPLAVTGRLNLDPPPSAGVSAAGTQSLPRPMSSVVSGEVPVTAELAFESVAWGTRLDLTCAYDRSSTEYDLPPSVTYALYVRTRDGHAEQVGTWRSVDGRTIRLTAATAASLDDIASVELRTVDGRTILRLAV